MSMDAQKPSHVPYAELTEEEHVEHNTNIWDQDDPVKALFHKLKQEVKKQNQHKKEEHDDEKEKSPYVHPFDFTELFQFDFYRSIVAEFLATQFFVTFSTLGIVAAIQVFTDGGATHTFIVVYHIFLILIVIYAFAHLSGAHFNPAVTIAVLFCRRVTVFRCVGYVLAQLLGAIAGAGTAQLALPDAIQGNLGQPVLVNGASAGQAFLMEFFCTFGLLFGSFAIAFDPRGWGKLGPIAVAIIVALNIHAGVTVSGPAMNPARVFGPAVITSNWDNQWVYWLGDLIGGGLGALIYEYIFMARSEARLKGVPSLGGDNFGATEEKKNN